MIGLLQHICSWSPKPQVYFKAGVSQLQVYADLKFSDYLFSQVAAGLSFYRYLALSQGLYAHLRFVRPIPIEVPLEHKFLALLRSLETIHGQQMQGQIQMLRHFPVKLSEDERETIVGEESKRVLKVFWKFVRELLAED